MKRSIFLVSAAGAFATMAATAGAKPIPRNRVSGLIVSVNGSVMVLQKRNGQNVTVDLSEAMANARVGVLAPGTPIVLHGMYVSGGTFHCTFTSHAGPDLRDWAGDL